MPDFTLASVDGAPVDLNELHAAGGAVLLFVSEDCPTCALTLRRLAALPSWLDERGVGLAVIASDPLEAAARMARRARFAGRVLSEPAPYPVSRSYGLATVPTALLLDRAGTVRDRVLGWDAEALEALLRSAGGGPAFALTRDPPLRKPGCAARSTYDPEAVRRLEAGPALDALEDMFEREWTDGLPVIPPTPERVEAMVGGFDPSQSLGEVAPAMGEATIERLAACAVLAGCRPDYFPVVVAAARAVLEPGYNLGGQAVTTQPAGQLIAVNGPVRAAIGLNSGMGALGPGWRANMTIGRAIRLLVALTGGGYPGRLDRATLGQPGKLGLCVAEDEEVSPWEALHVERGYEPEQSVVTAFACDAPLSISDHRSTTAPELARVLGWAAAATWSPNWWPLGGSSLFVICPEHAEMFRAAGWSKQRLREEIFDAVRRPAAELRWGETTPLVEHARDGELIGKWSDPEDIALIVAGGEAGRYSAVFGPCLGMAHRSISKEVRWST